MHRCQVVVIVAASLAACAPRVAPSPELGPATGAIAEPLPVNLPPGGAPELPEGPATVDQIMSTLSHQDQIAQVVMPWIPGSYAAFDDSVFARMRAWVDSFHVGGLIVSIGSPLDVAWKLNLLQQRSPLPLLVAADLEGGTAGRLNGGTPFPTNMGVAATGREADAYEMGRITAIEGRAVGIHLTFSPVADVNNNPANPIINTRSFGEDPKTVARLVAAEVHGIQDHGMLATAKHFPGHGDTGTDSHLSLPVVTADWKRLNAVELVPFRAAIDAGVAVIMSAHLAVPGLDSGRIRPATLAPRLLTGVLRDSLGFRGLTVTDALNMGGVVNGYGGGEAAVQAFLAGADLLLQPTDPGVVIAAMSQAVESGRITWERLQQSVRRVVALKLRLGLFQHRQVPLDSVAYVVGNGGFQATAQDIAQRSVVMVCDNQGTIDSLRQGPQPLALIVYGDETAPQAGTTLAGELRGLGYSPTFFKLWPASGPASLDTARVYIARHRMVVFAVAIKASAFRGTITLPDSVAALIDETAQEKRTALVSLGSPYLINQAPHVSSYLLAWSSNRFSETAVARALAGRAPLTGRLPISLPPGYPISYGLTRTLAPDVR
ncbi:MAG TPA: glycoside hydrolase family 3 N-terminal domain-containing protein [Gemmatimonadales bacterium]|nr:glycoside hydrolase family 3 N-terminal domain-containing protein [Gemmatimonadales bacterium]